jgi:hypothetical protein
MRLLILGTNKKYLSNIAHKEIAKVSPSGWSVVASFQKVRDYWTTFPETVMIGHTNIENIDHFGNRPIVVDNVVTQYFFSNIHVTNYLKNCKDFVLTTSSPIAYLNSEKLKLFDNIFVGHTTRVDNIRQYFTLFVDEHKCSFESFKKHINSLQENEYIEIDPATNTVSTPFARDENKDEEKETTKKTKTSQKKTECKTVDLKHDKDLEKKCPVSLEDITDMMTNVWVDDSKPSSKDFLPLWAFTQAGSLKDLEQSREFVKAMLSNELTMSMFKSSTFNTYETSDTYFFQIASTKYDLFSSVVLNILKTLKTRGILTKGFVMV